MPPHIEVYKTDDGWRWRRRAANGEITATGESYRRRIDAVDLVSREYPGILVRVEGEEQSPPEPVPPPEDDAT